MPTPRVLISDALSPAAVQIFKDRGVAVDFEPELGKDKDRLAAVVGGYDGLAIRSATKVTAKILESAKALKVIGRAGIGVDNVDIPAATQKGVIVMNTPFGNSITTAEHAVAMMFALARQIPQADASTQGGKWEKNRFMGVELTAKVLGVVGCGNIGSIVANRAIGLHMRVIAFDPYLTPERALELGVEKVELDELQIAEQMADYLLQGAIQNAVNFPSITAEEAPRLKPFVALAERLGSFLGQLTEAPIKGIRIEYEGAVAQMNTRALTSAAVTGVLRPFLQDINMVSAPVVARERGIMVEEVKRENAARDYESFIRIVVDAEDMPRHAGGTVFQDGKPRVTEIRHIAVDAEFAPNMLYVRNADKPGFIGAFGSLLGEAGVNIATFALGRDRQGGDAICFVAVDEPVSPELLHKIEAIPQVKRARAVRF